MQGEPPGAQLHQGEYPPYPPHPPYPPNQLHQDVRQRVPGEEHTEAAAERVRRTEKDF